MGEQDALSPDIACYTDLDQSVAQFRTLTLLPGDWADPIQCRLNVHALPDPPQYRTISYAWGESSDIAQITVNGVELTVPSSLERCLRHLRSPESAEENLWADAVCINQSNIYEKAHQVSNMGVVYLKCSSMFIWLGELNPDYPSQDPFEMVRHWAEDKHFYQYPGFSISEDTGGWIFDDNPEYQRMYELFADFTSRSWWSRLWIVQEIALSPAATVILGSWQLPWATLLTALANYYQHVGTCCAAASGVHPTKYTYDTDHLLFLSQQSDQTTNIEYIVRAFRHKLCKNPRDKIYGLLGLLWKNRSIQIRPDYSLPVNRVYLDATKAIISQSNGDLRFLTGLGFHSISYQLPSWIRNFNIPLAAYEANHEHSRYRRYRLYCASASTKGDIRVLDDNTLALTGTYIDRIERISTAITSRDWLRIRNVLKEWTDIANPLTTGQTYDDVVQRDRYWRTVIADVVPTSIGSSNWNRVPTPTDSTITACLADIAEHLRQGLEPPVSVAVQALWAATCSRAFFRTESGHVGLCFPHSKIGDEIWVLAGGRVPFVLRPDRDPEKTTADNTTAPRMRALVGECYLHGYMDGEALRECNAGLVPVHLK